MALKKAHTSVDSEGRETGVSHPAAHHRIGRLSIDQNARRAQFTVFIWKNRGARQAGKAPVAEAHYKIFNHTVEESPIEEASSFDLRMATAVLTLAGNEPEGQAEVWLKLHPDYVGAVDDNGP